MAKEKLFQLYFNIITVVFIIIAGLYIRGLSKKTLSPRFDTPQVSERESMTSPTQESTGPGPIVLPEEISYTIVDIKPDEIKVEKDGEPAYYGKDFIEEKGVYKQLSETKEILTYADLKVGQKLLVHTKDGQDVAGFQITD